MSRSDAGPAPMGHRRVLAAMSGGVDSAVALRLLQQAGYEAAGATMRLRDGCQGGIDDARASAARLGAAFYELDLCAEFERYVIAPFQAVYQQGGTPNPCIFCNRHLKFGLFLEKALALGYDAMATGHYARIRYDAGSGRYLLLRAADREKDQSYVLYSLTQAKLARTLLPLAELTKDEVRAVARELALPAAQRPESQDICFVPDGDYMAFLTGRGMEPQPGHFYDLQGRDLGPHQGMEAYTIGQRRGLGVAVGQRAYVVRKEPGRVFLGRDEDLFSRRVQVRDVNYIALAQPAAPLRVTAKLRYRQAPAPCTLHPTEDGAVLEFDTPQRAVTAGQAAVFYDGDVVVGGGEIAQSPA